MARSSALYLLLMLYRTRGKFAARNVRVRHRLPVA